MLVTMTSLTLAVKEDRRLWFNHICSFCSFLYWRCWDWPFFPDPTLRLSTELPARAFFFLGILLKLATAHKVVQHFPRLCISVWHIQLSPESAALFSFHEFYNEYHLILQFSTTPLFWCPLLAKRSFLKTLPIKKKNPARYRQALEHCGSCSSWRARIFGGPSS